MRFAADVDLVLDLDEDNLAAAIGVLERLGYRPRAPVALRGGKPDGGRGSEVGADEDAGAS